MHLIDREFWGESGAVLFLVTGEDEKDAWARLNVHVPTFTAT